MITITVMLVMVAVAVYVKRLRWDMNWYKQELYSCEHDVEILETCLDDERQANMELTQALSDMERKLWMTQEQLRVDGERLRGYLNELGNDYDMMHEVLSDFVTEHLTSSMDRIEQTVLYSPTNAKLAYDFFEGKTMDVFADCYLHDAMTELAKHGMGIEELNEAYLHMSEQDSLLGFIVHELCDTLILGRYDDVPDGQLISYEYDRLKIGTTLTDELPVAFWDDYKYESYEVHDRQVYFDPATKSLSFNAIIKACLVVSPHKVDRVKRQVIRIINQSVN